MMANVVFQVWPLYGLLLGRTSQLVNLASAIHRDSSGNYCSIEIALYIQVFGMAPIHV